MQDGHALARPSNGETAALVSNGLRCWIESVAGAVTVSVRGELDVASASGLEARLSKLLRLPTRSVTLDVSGVSFVDSGGLGMLVRVGRTAKRHRIEFDIVNPNPRTSWMLSLIGLAPRVPLTV